MRRVVSMSGGGASDAAEAPQSTALTSAAAHSAAHQMKVAPAMTFSCCLGIVTARDVPRLIKHKMLPRRRGSPSCDVRIDNPSGRRLESRASQRFQPKWPVIFSADFPIFAYSEPASFPNITRLCRTAFTNERRERAGFRGAMKCNRHISCQYFPAQMTTP
jgi:hypothetical protein